MKKIIFCFLVYLMLVCIPQAAFAQNMQTIPIMFNYDEPSGLNSYVKGATVYVPLRDVLERCCVEVHWDNSAKQTIISDGLSATVIRQQGRQWYIDGKAARPEQTPLLYKGKLYLPYTFMDNLCEAEITLIQKGTDTDQLTKEAINVQFPLVYVDGQWHSDGKPIKEAAEGVYYICFHIGEMTVGSDHLWALYPDGRCKRLTSDWRINEWLIKDNVCYYMAKQTVFPCAKYKIYAVDLETSQKTQLGSDDYFYNLSIKKDGPLYVLGNEPASLSSLLTDKGVITTGIATLAATDEFVNDEELMRQTYGVYLLPLDGGPQVLQRTINID